MTSERRDHGELAFENGFDESPDVLWRVYAIRDWRGREIRMVNWFATEEAARQYASLRTERGDEVRPVEKYVRAAPERSGAEREG